MVRTERTRFTGHAGAELDARMEWPAGEPQAFAVFAHCFTCSKQSHAAVKVSRALTRHGFAVLRFDFTGLGGSEGEFGNTDFAGNVEDVVRAAEHVERTLGPVRLLVGHSLGGAAVLKAAGRLPSVQAVSTINAPAEPSHVRKLLRGRDRDAEQVEIGGRTFRVSDGFLDDLDEQRMRETIRALRRPLLVFHSPTDTVVGVDNARAIFEAALHPKSFVALDGADHLLTREEDARFVADLLGAWTARYLPQPAAPEATLPEEGRVEVSEVDPAPYAQRIRVGAHQLQADEPTSFGGHDTGPSPYDLLGAALGACTSMTLRMYAARKGWPLEKVTVRLRHQKVHARDCAECEARDGRIDQVDRELVLEGPLDDEQRQRLLEIADRCPVHRTLESEVVVRTTLGPPERTAG